MVETDESFPTFSNSNGGAMASRSSSWLSFLVLIFVVFVCLCCLYVHHWICKCTLHMSGPHRYWVFHHAYNISDEITRPTGSLWIVVSSRTLRRRRRESKQRRGCRFGVMLRKQPYKPTLPSLYLANTRSLVNKTDYLELQILEIMFETAAI